MFAPKLAVPTAGPVTMPVTSKPVGAVMFTDPRCCAAASLRIVAVKVTEVPAGEHVGSTSAEKASPGSATADPREAAVHTAASTKVVRNENFRLRRGVIGSALPFRPRGSDGRPYGGHPDLSRRSLRRSA
jgi:hypothetical protein